MNDLYPLNFFKTIISPIRSFTNRNYLAVWQKILSLIFLVSLLLIPVSFQQTRLTTADLTHYVPDSSQLVTQEVLNQLKQYESREYQLFIDTEHTIENTDQKWVAFIADDQGIEKQINNRLALVFAPNGFYMSEPNRPVIYQPYLDTQALQMATDEEGLLSTMSKQWYDFNRNAVQLTNMINISLLLLTSFTILLAGATFFLSMMKNSDLYSINSINEAFTVALNCYALPTFLAMMIGFFTNNPTTMLTALGLLFVVMLMTSYWKTHFNDDYVEEQILLDKNNEDDDYLI